MSTDDQEMRALAKRVFTPRAQLMRDQAEPEQQRGNRAPAEGVNPPPRGGRDVELSAWLRDLFHPPQPD